MVASVNDSLQESQFEPFQLDSDGGNQEVDEIVVDQPWSDTYEPIVSLPKDTAGDVAEPIVTKRRPTSLLGRTLRWMMERYRDFFSSRFDDVEMERRFSEENWDSQRRPAFWSAIFMIINWVLGCAFIVQPMVLADKIFYFLFGPLLSIPLIWMIMIGFPLKHAITYQIFLCASIWSWSFYQVLFSFLCGYYGVPQGSFSCGTRDFLTIFYPINILERRSSGMILNFKISWIRTRTCRWHIIFSADEPELIMFVKHERRLFTLRQQVKLQYKVRVPLNTALLAVQNMEASGAITKRFEIEFNALEGSLSMMSKAIGWIVASSSPRFDLTLYIKSCGLYLSLCNSRRMRVTCNSRLVWIRESIQYGLFLFDVARREAYRAMGRSQEEIKQLLEEDTEAAGMVVGDETRLRQIVTNLASNACKFTPAGGRLGIKTRLIFPPPDEHAGDSGDRPPSNRRSTETNRSSSLASRIVVRIEVSDTGWGIRAKDMADARLFCRPSKVDNRSSISPGGKGTGLGLALVRQIVNLSGGRLGVKSKVGEGSTFWVELPLGVGAETLELSSLPPVPSLTGCGRQTHRVSKVYDFVEDGTNCFRDSASVLSGGEGGGCTVETAENGEAALAMILRSQYSGDAPENPEDETSNGPYDVVFMDNQMPVMSGLTAVAKLRALSRHDFIVGVTGNALLTDQHEYLEAGVDKVLTKPVLEKSLKEMLSLALGRSDTSRPHEKPP
ncbi:hypothetical protein PLEOSDRAFT_1084474 [Pleurotus ostreatus PC15]|uniref:histidine kinase n=1 Tax=Pleurotus ostreatus (strain PC15) TaxID=1137138 RepID=A0A067NRD8_PLEO1|nr:hypothetical protein PLEOSDRAFT_1084474 [Pleurotus ostreatus PC15]